MVTDDKNETDARMIWDAYEAYIGGVIISYTSQKRVNVWSAWRAGQGPSRTGAEDSWCR